MLLGTWQHFLQPRIDTPKKEEKMLCLFQLHTVSPKNTFLSENANKCII